MELLEIFVSFECVTVKISDKYYMQESAAFENRDVCNSHFFTYNFKATFPGYHKAVIRKWNDVLFAMLVGINSASQNAK